MKLTPHASPYKRVQCFTLTLLPFKHWFIYTEIEQKLETKPRKSNKTDGNL